MIFGDLIVILQEFMARNDLVDFVTVFHHHADLLNGSYGFCYIFATVSSGKGSATFSYKISIALSSAITHKLTPATYLISQMDSNTNTSTSPATSTVGFRLDVDLALLQADPDLMAKVRALIASKQPSAATSSAPLTTATETAPLPASDAATPAVVTSTKPSPTISTSDLATPAVETTTAPPLTSDSSPLVISHVLGSLAEDTTTTLTPEHSSPPPAIVPLPSSTTTATLEVLLEVEVVVL